MKINALQNRVNAADIPPEELAGNKVLTRQQKINEASRQFEAILLRQVLSETQKTVIPSEFSDNSTAAGIYQDMITNVLADDMSKSGTFGFARIFERQLSPPATKDAANRLNGVAHKTTDSLPGRRPVSTTQS